MGLYEEEERPKEASAKDLVRFVEKVPTKTARAVRSVPVPLLLCINKLVSRRATAQTFKDVNFRTSQVGILAVDAETPLTLFHAPTTALKAMHRLFST